jgi:hypothetical protein
LASISHFSNVKSYCKQIVNSWSSVVMMVFLGRDDETAGLALDQREWSDRRVIDRGSRAGATPPRSNQLNCPSGPPPEAALAPATCAQKNFAFRQNGPIGWSIASVVPVGLFW